MNSAIINNVGMLDLTLYFSFYVATLADYLLLWGFAIRYLVLSGLIEFRAQLFTIDLFLKLDK